MLLLVLALMCLAGSVYLVAEYVSLPARERMLSFRRASAYGRRRHKKDTRLQGSLRDRALVPAMEHAARTVLRINPKMSVDAVGLKLLSAGMGRRISPMAFLATKGFAAIIGLVAGFVFVSASKSLAMGIAAGAALGAIGFIGPDFVLNHKIRSRQERLRADLPDALDLLAASDARFETARVRLDLAATLSAVLLATSPSSETSPPESAVTENWSTPPPGG